MSLPPIFLRLRVPAKVNLSLRVVGKREDGYHLLETLMVPVSLYDDLAVRVHSRAPRKARVVCRVLAGECVPGGGSNLAARAAEAILDASGSPRRVEIELRKRIPVGAGLGGGSSDAAGVLYALNRLPDFRVKRQSLLALAGQLGADVPFCLCSRPALATGIGDRLRFVSGLPELHAVVAVPEARVSTAWAYANALKSLTSRPKGTTGSLLRLGRSRFGDSLHNDFQAGVVAAVPDVARLVERLMGAGASATVMSGTGSAVVGVFGTAREAAAAAGGFAGADRAFAVKVLRRRPAVKS